MRLGIRFLVGNSRVFSKIVSGFLLACSTYLMAVPGVSFAQENVSYSDGDAAAGQTASAPCAVCHGADGNSAAANFPKIAGQNPRYLFKQLQDMKSGARPVPLMTSFVADMSEQTMADLAAYYSEQTPSLGAVDPELKELGESIYRAGIADRGVPACMACHGPDGAGVPAAGYPALGGQHAQYTQTQLLAFRAAARGDDVPVENYRQNDGDSMIMRSVVKTMSDEEIKAVSSYISGLYGN